MPSTKINNRGLTSFFTLFGFLIMSITGLVLYIGPAGRVAYWTIWTFGGLSKDDWGNIHILSSILFIVAGAVHIYFNWKPLMHYFKDKARKAVRLRKELGISLALSVWIIVSSIWPFPPLSYLLDFNAWLKDVWIVQDHYEPPFGHAELLSLKTFATKMDIDLEKAVQELKSNGVAFNSTNETLEDIARNNNTAPMDLYLMIKKFEPVPSLETLYSYTPESIEVEFSGTGIGNKTVASVCERLGLDTTVIVQRLSAAGLRADIDKTLKSVAEEGGTDPIEVVKVFLLEGYLPKEAE
jgi:hypothetical protein